MEISDISLEALRRYFKSLEALGYMKYSEVNKLIVLLFIEELLTGPMAIYITEEDYKTILEGLECLYGSSCMIDLPTYNVYDSLIHKTLYYLKPKQSEDALLRFTLLENLRAEL